MKFEVLKQSHVKRNIIIGVGVILILVACILTFTRAKYRVTESIPLVNGTINYSLPDIQIVALYINGVEAEELDSTKSYTLDTTQSTCTYKDGTTIDNLTLNYDSDTKSFSISPYTTKGTKCTLYFDESNKATDIIEGLEPNNQDILVYDDYGNLRYIGTDPNNYVLFNDELWRIIGIFSEDTHGVAGTELIKIIRDESIGNYAWDNKPSGTGSSISMYGSNDWSDSALQVVLNEGAYWSRTNGTCPSGIRGATKNCDFSSTGLTEEAKAMIETVTWKLGGTANYESSSNGLVTNWYNYERGTTVYSGHATEWTGKIGLMYPSDYGYATSEEVGINRKTCLATELYVWDGQVECSLNNWLLDSSAHQWTLTPYTFYSYGIFYVRANGMVDYLDVYYETSVRPSVYLTSEVKISSGYGSASNPYVLTM